MLERFQTVHRVYGRLKNGAWTMAVVWVTRGVKKAGTNQRQHWGMAARMKGEGLVT